MVFKKVSKELRKRLSSIKLLVLDFDGILTDNKVYTDSQGKESVVCDRRDSLGLEYLKKSGEVDIIILSKERDDVVSKRANKLGIKVVQCIDDKSKELENIISRCRYSYAKVCYVGNDLNDLECLKKVGLGITVSDAERLIKKNVRYVTKSKGGKGAIREVCDIILLSKKKHPHQKELEMI